jgi:hypothetical protein
VKINTEILSIPPYLSTSWNHVVALRAEHKQHGFTLFVTLSCGSTVDIPNLPHQVVEEAFTAHTLYSERKKLPSAFSFPPSLGISLPGLDTMASLLQHNPEDSSQQDLPSEVIERISQLSSLLSEEELQALPDSEPHCNCAHCQIIRALQGKEKEPLPQELDDEIVSDRDLTFSDWKIQAISHELYKVTNPFDEAESYNVFIGSPVGCTCGCCNCEHIKAVLRS